MTFLARMGLVAALAIAGCSDIPELPKGPRILQVFSCGGSFSWSNEAEDGFYDSGGNLLLYGDTGFEGLGPRLYLAPSPPFPSDVDCQLSVSSGVTDKDGISLQLPTRPIAWHTASLIPPGGDKLTQRATVGGRGNPRASTPARR